MNSSETAARTRGAAPPPLIDARFGKLVVLVNAVVPAALLGWDALHHALGADAVKYALHTTGLLGLIFLVITLVVTPLRRFTGAPQLIALRRSLGLTGFFYLCAHFAIFFLLDRAGSVSSTLHEIVIRRFLQIGTAALLLLVPLAITSTDRMVTWLGAKRWKALHRLAYLATGLGALHYYLSVKADVRQPLVFAGVLALLLAMRPIFFALDRQRARERKLLASFAPARTRFWSGELSVRAIVEETPDVRTFRLGAVDGGALPFIHQPGQYLNLALSIDGRRVNRSYTLASSPTQTGSCEITVKRDPRGVASRYLHDTLNVGSVLRVSAPAGRFVFTGGDDAGQGRGVVLVAGGVGITPLMAMVRYLADRAWAGDIFLVFSVREEIDVVFARELAELQRRLSRLHVTVTVTGAHSPTWSGARGRISLELLRRCVPDLAQHPFYLCGPDAMMAEVTAMLRSASIPEAQIKTEAFVSLPSAEEVELPGAPTPASTPAPTPALPADATFALRFARSDTTTQISAGQSLLEAAEDAGIELPFECRSGICGQCKTRLLEGRVTMAVQDALGAGDRSRHLVLACQAHAVSDLIVDA